MSVTITRTAWIDDDGTGTTGTVLNNAIKTDLYNQIDGALAKVAQLNGGNAFAGIQTINGIVNISGSADAGGNQVFIAFDSGVHFAGISLQNTNANNSAWMLAFANSAGGQCGNIQQSSATSIGYNTTSDQRLKTDHGRATDAPVLRAVVVHDFTWKPDGVRARGVFAQEAYAVIPGAIAKGSDDLTERGDLARPWATDYSKFVPDLIVGWQQHEAAIAALRAQLATATPAGVTA
jgi:hypothetical protein